MWPGVKGCPGWKDAGLAWLWEGVEGPEVWDDEEKLLGLWLADGRLAVGIDWPPEPFILGVEEECWGLWGVALPARGDKGVEACPACH